jgi:hypothetical protein
MARKRILAMAEVRNCKSLKFVATPLGWLNLEHDSAIMAE